MRAVVKGRVYGMAGKDDVVEKQLEWERELAAN